MASRKDIRLYETAVRNEWPISDEYKQVLIKSMMRIIADPATTPREKTSAARVVMIANAQNQTEEIFNGTVERPRNRFLEIAERLGIVVDSEVVSGEAPENNSDAVGVPSNGDND
jgi:hypothetical protein